MATAAIPWSPMEACARLRGERGRVALISAREDDGATGWSFVAAAPSETLEVRGRQIVRRDSDGAEVEREHGDALLAIERFAARHGHVLDTAAPTTEPPPWPRVMGYLGYELARHVEALGPGATTTTWRRFPTPGSVRTPQ